MAITKKVVTKSPAPAPAVVTVPTIDIGALFHSVWDCESKMASLLQDIPKHADVTPSDVIDMLGYIKNVKKASEKLEGIYKELVYAKLGPMKTDARTDSFEVLISVKTRTTLDQEKVLGEIMEELGEVEYATWLSGHQKSTEYKEMSVKPNKTSSG